MGVRATTSACSIRLGWWMGTRHYLRGLDKHEPEDKSLTEDWTPGMKLRFAVIEEAIALLRKGPVNHYYSGHVLDYWDTVRWIDGKVESAPTFSLVEIAETLGMDLAVLKSYMKDLAYSHACTKSDKVLELEVTQAGPSLLSLTPGAGTQADPVSGGGGEDLAPLFLLPVFDPTVGGDGSHDWGCGSNGEPDLATLFEWPGDHPGEVADGHRGYVSACEAEGCVGDCALV